MFRRQCNGLERIRALECKDTREHRLPSVPAWPPGLLIQIFQNHFLVRKVRRTVPLAHTWSEDESRRFSSREPWTQETSHEYQNFLLLLSLPLKISTQNTSPLSQTQSARVVKRSGYRASLLEFKCGLNTCLPLDLGPVTQLHHALVSLPVKRVTKTSAAYSYYDAEINVYVYSLYI